MKRSSWVFVLLSHALLATAGCSAVNSAVDGEPRTPALLFERPVADRQALQSLSSQAGIYPSLSALLASPSSQEVWLVNIKSPLVDADNSELAIRLPEGSVVRFNLKRFSTVAGMSGWVGDVASERKQRYPSPDEVDFDPFNWISLVREDAQVVGDIHIDGQLYRLEPIGMGQHVLVKVDESKMPVEGEPVMPTPSRMNIEAGKTPKSAHSTIRVMFVTTNERRARSPNYRAELVQALQNANQYLINSHIPITYELAGFVDPDYSQGTKSQWAMLQEMAKANSALGSKVSTQRDLFAAHLVSLYNTESSICGNAYGRSRKETGFNTISCTVALAHELGHNLGGGHGLVGNDPSKGYNHGYRHYSPNFHTIQVTSHGAIPYFSNPRLQYQGRALGTVQNHDVARQFSEYREVVEAFYPQVRTITLYEHTNYQGKTCSFLHVGRTTTSVLQQCGREWAGMVSSAKVQGVKPGNYLLFLGPGNRVSRSYTSDSYSGDLNIPQFNSDHTLPPGMRMSSSEGSLNDRVEVVNTFD
ncbi:metallopeptidase [Pseudomonas xanthosomatis]|uniref:metallopeptidase n=1 Tax=Pseudomonas xanthosomatis TaxID=2842356 RepID=UPI001C3D5A87|nr:metallopeptidase [Pseudomonas xanthosomatis]QXH46388.1 metallopeptidase [Pseudomonas xanthosomatis]